MNASAARRGRRRPVLEALFLLGIVGVVVVIGVRVCSYQRMSSGPQRFGQPNVDSREQVIPGRPHDVAVLLTDPEAIRRRVAFHWSSDENGFRGGAVPREKPAGEFRVAVVGECVAFGNGVEDDEPWPARLEELLGARLQGRTAEVINASAPDPPSVVLERLDRLVPDFDPDVVMISPGAELVFDGSQPYVHGEDPQVRWGQHRDGYHKGIRKALETCRRHGVKRVLVTPTFNTFTNPGAYAWNAWVAEVGSDLSVPVLDTTALLKAREARDGLLFEREATTQRLVAVEAGTRSVLLEVEYTGDKYVAPDVYAWLDDHPEVSLSLSIDENHPNPDGHRVIAQAALELFEEQGWLEPAAR